MPFEKRRFRFSEVLEESTLVTFISAMPLLKKREKRIGRHRFSLLPGQLDRLRHKAAERFDLGAMFLKKITHLMRGVPPIPSNRRAMFLKKITHLMLVIQVPLRSVNPVSLVRRTEEITKIVTDNPESKRKERRNKKLIDRVTLVLLEREK